MGRLVIIALCLLVASPCFGDAKDLLQDGVKGGAAGAVGSQIENPLVAGLAGAGTGIAAGAIMDTFWGDKPEAVVEKEVVYVEKPVYVNPQPTQTVNQIDYTPRKKRTSREYSRGYDDGYKDGYQDAMTEVNSFCEERI